MKYGSERVVLSVINVKAVNTIARKKEQTASSVEELSGTAALQGLRSQVCERVGERSNYLIGYDNEPGIIRILFFLRQ